ncbi:O-linked N-acetylglucosamine transferase family protein [Magnetococcus sp. PR-3]|uniref:O-linked N-acetylglucosamine transferase family protein n=1 Tax=Magnetococcus sp. PR-3 TaxID=3120355 RepID=UPI002FCE6819
MDIPDKAYQSLLNSGKQLQQHGNHAAAIEALKQAITQQPQQADAWYQLAQLLLTVGQLPKAESLFLEAEKRAPGRIDILNALGALYQRQGKLQQAAQMFQQGLEHRPNNPFLLFNLGVSLAGLGQEAEALTYYQKAVALHPEEAGFHLNLANLLNRQGAWVDALEHFQQAHTLQPHTLQGAIGMANALKSLGQSREALALIEPLTAQNPNHLPILTLCGQLLREHNRRTDARAMFQRAIALDPNYFTALYGYATTLLDLGKIPLAIEHLKRAITIQPQNRGLCSDLAFALHYLPVEPSQLYAIHRHYHQQVEVPLQAHQPVHPPCQDPDKPLRIGLVSSDLRAHPVSFFLEAPMEHHDRTQFAFYLYSNSPTMDKVSQRLQAWSEGWCNIHTLNDAQAAEQIQQDGIDILIDLNGHTGGNRLPLFALKPAPVQISWLGYADTTGLDAVDYRLTDLISDPEGEGRYMSEKPIHMEKGFHCYRPLSTAPAVNPQPRSTGQGIRLGSFNTLAKMGDEILKLWAEILKHLPDATLTLKNGGFGIADVVTDYRHRFTQLGVDPNRITFLGITESFEEHLELYNQLDIALDTYPYHGTTTTCEALWMGVPVVTMQGNHHVNRVGGSLLHQVGLSELVTHRPEDYLSCVVALAQPDAPLKTLRQTIRQKIENSPLRDEQGFTRQLERTLRQIWMVACLKNQT